MRNLILCLSGSVLAVVCVLGVGVLQRQTPDNKSAHVDKAEQEMKAAREKLDETLPMVDFDEPLPADRNERAKREVKNKRHDLGRPPLADGLDGMSGVYHWPAGFPAIPLAESSVVVIGQVTSAKAHLSDDRSGVYTEITMTVDEVVKGKDEIRPGMSVVGERDGGRVRFASGSVFRYYISDYGIPKVDTHYLLFLEQLEDGAFQIMTGYELLEGRIVPLDDSMPFSKYNGVDASTFLNQVKDPARKWN